MRDTVRYALPYWPLGEVAHALVVRRDLAAIFAFRHRRWRGGSLDGERALHAGLLVAGRPGSRTRTSPA